MNRVNKITNWAFSRFVDSIISIEALELKTDGDTILLYNATLLNKKKNKVEIGSSIVLATIEQLKNWLEHKTQKIVLLLNSDKILNKITQKNTTEGNDQEILKSIIPSAAIENFYLQQTDISDETVLLTVCRKNFVDHLVTQFDFCSKQIIYLVIGPFAINYISALFPHYNPNHFEIGFQNYEAIIASGNLSSLLIHSYRLPNKSQSHDTHKQIKIGDEQIDEYLLLPYALSIQFFLSPLSLPSISNDFKNNLDEYSYARLQKPIVMYSSVALLLILLFSSILFTIYKDKYAELNMKAEAAQFNSIRNKELTEKLIRQQQLLQQSSLESSSQLAFYADQITYGLPDDIYLNKLTLHPLKTQFETSNPTFDNTRISISGNCYSGNDLNSWLKQLKTLRWIKGTTIKQFKQNDPDELGSFQLELVKDSTND